MNSKNSDYKLDYERGIHSLEDIQLLADFKTSTIVSQAYFYMSELKRKADELNSQKIGSCDAVLKVLDERFEMILNDFFCNKVKYKNFEFKKSTLGIDLNKWNSILEVIPEVLSVVSFFNYYGPIEASLDEKKIVISGIVLEDGSLEINRKFIYIITRKLLRKKILLTFNLAKTERIGVFRLDLKVDLSHDETLIYKVNFKINSKENYLLGFSNILCQYRAQVHEVEKIGEHNVIEITNNLNVSHEYKIPELGRLDSANKEILHFSFLFRPISIILPMKGNLSTDIFLKKTVPSYDDLEAKEQDVSHYYQQIDFFSFFNF